MASSSSSEVGPTLNLTTSIEYDAVPFNSSTDLFVMGSLKAPLYESEARQNRAPIDIICVIDRSGSMSGQKIELVKKTLCFMVEQLKELDKISLVSFDSNVTLDLKLTEMTSQGKKKALASIEKLRAGTCTNLSGGLFEAYDIIKHRYEPNDVASILLFTDGLANKGVTTTPEIVKNMEGYQKDLGPEKTISIFTFGFGQDHDANMLRAISDAGNGLYYFLQKEDEIPQSFADCLGGLLSVVGQGIVFKIEPVGDTTLKKIHSTNYKLKDNGRDLIVGDLYSEEQRDIVFQVQLAAKSTPIPAGEVVVRLSLEYFNVYSSHTETFGPVDVLVKRLPESEITSTNREVNITLDKQRNRLIAAEALNEGRRLADGDNLEKAREVLNAAINQISLSPSQMDSFCQGLVTDLQNCISGLSDSQAYNSVGSKMMNNYYQTNSRQRSTNANSAAQESYTTSLKSSMKNKFSFIKKK